jgi:hypothetical protein
MSLSRLSESRRATADISKIAGVGAVDLDIDLCDSHYDLSPVDDEVIDFGNRPSRA